MRLVNWVISSGLLKKADFFQGSRLTRIHFFQLVLWCNGDCMTLSRSGELEGHGQKLDLLR